LIFTLRTRKPTSYFEVFFEDASSEIG